MDYPKEQTEELKPYCSGVYAVTEGGVTFLYLEGLCLPAGCDPPVCDALLCPVWREGYPSRLYLSAQVRCPYSRNWNVGNARICERRWFAFSWKVELSEPTLARVLIAHLNGFTKER